jgi:prepilin-type N-terminal cleavage/methylation domain-containing protein
VWGFARTREQDSGFTLAELLVVASLMGIILAASWLAFSAITASDKVTSSATAAAHDMSDPLESISKTVMQNNGFNITLVPPGVTAVTPTAYRMLVWTNRNLSTSTAELDAFYANSAGELVWERWLYNSNKTAFTTHVKWVMTTANANVEKNKPLFTYLDATGAAITDMNQVPAKTRSVRVDAVAKLADGKYASDSRLILLRNRN